MAVVARKVTELADKLRRHVLVEGQTGAVGAVAGLGSKDNFEGRLAEGNRIFVGLNERDPLGKAELDSGERYHRHHVDQMRERGIMHVFEGILVEDPGRVGYFERGEF